MGYAFSQHALGRMRQRGFREADVDYIIERGTPTGEGYLLTGRDVAERLTELKSEIERLRRLKGAFVAVADGTILSVYRPGKRKRRGLVH